MYYVYGLDTSCFYSDTEKKLSARLSKARQFKRKVQEKLEKSTVNQALHKVALKHVNAHIVQYKKDLQDALSANTQTRELRSEYLNEYKVISVFGSTLTRSLGMRDEELSDEMMIIRVYYFAVAEQIIKNGFYHNGERYVYFSSSAGQIRTKKIVCVKERTLRECEHSLNCGLTVERINAMGGMNVNKYLSYLALCNSATEEWREFDITKCIVVDDFENTVRGEVDFIDDTNYTIERKVEELPFTQTDGCGMILPTTVCNGNSGRNFMVRLPWVKGLLASFDFRKFILGNNAIPVVKDIYGQEHDVIAEDIQVIFTKSQFKAWKYYKDWNEYITLFQRYKCTAGVCNIEEKYIPDSPINYQMIQTLSDLSDDEIRELAKENVQILQELNCNPAFMLKVFGAVEGNPNGFQKSLLRYPNLLNDVYCKQTLRDLKKKLEKDLWSARFEIGGKYTFAIPDLYAFCEHLFLQIKKPQGLLKNGEVSCRLFKDGEELDCLRSPHLYIEHPVRVNKMQEWFTTKAVYISCHDLLPRIIQNDFDGDKLLVTNNKTLIQAAKRHNVVPLFYNMRKAAPEEINSAAVYEGLRKAYTGGNIGMPSNDITKIWNSGEITDEQLTAVKFLVAEVNYTIDYAKTLYKPQRPDWVNELIRKYTKAKVPHFFVYAKDKEINQVEKPSENVVDRIKKLYPPKRMQLNASIGKYDCRMLMSNPQAEVDKAILERYKKIVSRLKFSGESDKKMRNYQYECKLAKEKIIGDDDIDTVVDTLVKGLSSKKKMLWVLFGDEIYQNICRNTKEITCCDCGKVFIADRVSRRIRCDECQKRLNAEKARKHRRKKSA